MKQCYFSALPVNYQCKLAWSYDVVIARAGVGCRINYVCRENAYF